jgi:hypothetical protein
VGDAQLVEQAQGGAGEVAQLRVVTLALQLGDHHDGEDDLVLGEATQCAGIGEQDAGVEHVRAHQWSLGLLLPGGASGGGQLRRGGLGRHDSPLTGRRAHSSWRP